MARPRYLWRMGSERPHRPRAGRSERTHPGAQARALSSPRAPAALPAAARGSPQSLLRQKENELKQANAELEERGKLLYKTKVRQP